MNNDPAQSLRLKCFACCIAEHPDSDAITAFAAGLVMGLRESTWTSLCSTHRPIIEGFRAMVASQAANPLSSVSRNESD